MVSPWELLGLDAGADTRSIKRRYAQLLKQTRPDEDPESFQRLREAYEWALDWAQRTQNVDEPPVVHESVTPPPFGDGQRAFAPLTETQSQDSDENAWICSLPDSCASLDDALFQAREAGLEQVLELELLRRSQLPGERAIEIVRWAMARLDWLTPWQADYLSPQVMAQLAERLLDCELATLQADFGQMSEAEFITRIRALGRQKWLRPLELSRRLQLAVMALLEARDDWSLSALESATEVFGWSEMLGNMPFSADRWAGLSERAFEYSVVQRLREQLNLDVPVSPEQAATWFLLKPLEDDVRRRMAERFGEPEWRACEQLDQQLRSSSTLARSFGGYQKDWRDWKSLSWGRWATIYVWLLTAVVLFASQLYLSANKPEPTLARDGIAALAASVLVSALLSVFRRVWGRLAKLLDAQDRWLSRRLVPLGLASGRHGLLLIRHLAPLAFLSLLVSGWARQLPGWWGPGLGLATAVGGCWFLARVTQGVPANAWVLRIGGLFNRHTWVMMLVWLALIIGGSILGATLGPKGQRATSPDYSHGLENPCAHPTDAEQQRFCDEAAQMVRKAMGDFERQRSGESKPQG
ncbi:J domain-containing protein [Pseudomonas fulva]|uniref:Heat shock protein DnaJ domain protein n=1 Tax=Pseudomonas fulva (strain 12-X) TaxID=743720 RepID=F6AHN3_PSEF1|nr:J domain-containing protein [Pseudomonas fulva]AEF20499.1 heat shock protein DnaJ domain protein [Pseudomonas fulva 12-X]